MKQKYCGIIKEMNNGTKRILAIQSEWPPLYGRGHSLENIAKQFGVSATAVFLALKRQGVKRRTISETRQAEKNPMWKGDAVGYGALHRWVHRNKPKPSHCENCKQKKVLEAVNISQKYKRSLDDWKWLCRKCHMLEDGRMGNLKNYG